MNNEYIHMNNEYISKPSLLPDPLKPRLVVPDKVLSELKRTV